MKGVGDALKRPKKGVGESGERYNRKKQRIRVVVEPKGNVLNNGSNKAQNNDELTTNIEKHLEAIKDGKECEINQQNEHEDNTLLVDVRQGDIFGPNDDDDFGVIDLVGENNGEGSGEGISDVGESPKELECPKLVLELNGENLDGSFFRPVVDIHTAKNSRPKNSIKDDNGENIVDKIVGLKDERKALMQSLIQEKYELQDTLRAYTKIMQTEESRLRKHDAGQGVGKRETIEKRLRQKREAVTNAIARVKEIEAKLLGYKPDLDLNN